LACRLQEESKTAATHILFDEYSETIYRFHRKLMAFYQSNVCLSHQQSTLNNVGKYL